MLVLRYKAKQTVIHLHKFVYQGHTPTMVKLTRKEKYSADLALQYLVKYLYLYKK